MRGVRENVWDEQRCVQQTAALFKELVILHRSTSLNDRPKHGKELAIAKQQSADTRSAV